jgi:hypothetical protein
MLLVCRRRSMAGVYGRLQRRLLCVYMPPRIDHALPVCSRLQRRRLADEADARGRGSDVVQGRGRGTCHEVCNVASQGGGIKAERGLACVCV